MSYVKPVKKKNKRKGIGNEEREPAQVPLWAAMAALGIAALVLGRRVR